jgi:AMP-binding enzyme
VCMLWTLQSAWIVFVMYLLLCCAQRLRRGCICGCMCPSVEPCLMRQVVGEGRCPIVDTWWQTETAGHMITPLPAAWPEKPGSASLPFFGVVPAVVNDKGEELEGACEGYLCIKQAWPSTIRTVYGDHERYETTYFAPFKVRRRQQPDSLLPRVPCAIGLSCCVLVWQH